MAWRLFRSVLTIYLSVCALVFLFQRRLQYFPTRQAVRLPMGERYRGIEDVELQTADELRIHAWYWPGARPVTLVIFHGNGGDRSHRLDWMETLHGLGLGVFVLDYRGYGGSQGSPTETGLYTDAEVALDWLSDRSVGDLVYVGESLGSGVAVEMAVRRPPAALIIQSGFSSAVDVARSVYWFLPVRLLMSDPYDSIAKIDKLHVPLLQVHGESDSVVPVNFGKRLFEAAGGPKEWLGIPGADHNDALWRAKGYREKLDDFLSKHLLQ